VLVDGRQVVSEPHQQVPGFIFRGIGKTRSA
jgi:hypothetical protein